MTDILYGNEASADIIVVQKSYFLKKKPRMMVDVRTFSSATCGVLKSQQENLSNGKASVTRCYRGIFFLEKRPKHGSGANDEDEKSKK